VPFLSWCGPRWVAAVVVAVVAAAVAAVTVGTDGRGMGNASNFGIMVSAATPGQRVHKRRQQSVDSGSGLFIRLALSRRCTTSNNAAKAAIRKTLTTMPVAGRLIVIGWQPVGKFLARWSGCRLVSCLEGVRH
jgi:hypothetical protein